MSRATAAADEKLGEEKKGEELRKEEERIIDIVSELTVSERRRRIITEDPYNHDSVFLMALRRDVTSQPRRQLAEELFKKCKFTSEPPLDGSIQADFNDLNRVLVAVLPFASRKLGLLNTILRCMRQVICAELEAINAYYPNLDDSKYSDAIASCQLKYKGILVQWGDTLDRWDARFPRCVSNVVETEYLAFLRHCLDFRSSEDVFDTGPLIHDHAQGYTQDFQKLAAEEASASGSGANSLTP